MSFLPPRVRLFERRQPKKSSAKIHQNFLPSYFLITRPFWGGRKNRTIERIVHIKKDEPHRASLLRANITWKLDRMPHSHTNDNLLLLWSISLCPQARNTPLKPERNNFAKYIAKVKTSSERAMRRPRTHLMPEISKTPFKFLVHPANEYLRVCRWQRRTLKYGASGKGVSACTHLPDDPK